MSEDIWVAKVVGRRDNYKVIEQKLANLEEFNGNSLRGYWFDGVYQVISYYTLVATSSPDKKWVTSNKYSVTTSKQCNIIKRAWGL